MKSYFSFYQSAGVKYKILSSTSFFAYTFCIKKKSLQDKKMHIGNEHRYRFNMQYCHDFTAVFAILFYSTVLRPCFSTNYVCFFSLLFSVMIFSLISCCIYKSIWKFKISTYISKNMYTAHCSKAINLISSNPLAKSLVFWKIWLTTFMQHFSKKKKMSLQLKKFSLQINLRSK